VQRDFAVLAAFAVPDDQVAFAGRGPDITEVQGDGLAPPGSGVQLGAGQRPVPGGGAFDCAQPSGEFSFAQCPGGELGQFLALGGRGAHDHGLTTTELADLLHLPSHRIRQITTITDLDDLPLRTIRALASALDLPWPSWAGRAPAGSQPGPGPSGGHDTTTTSSTGPVTRHSDADQVHAVLALVLGQPLRYDQIADALDWPAGRVQHALTQLAPLTPGRHGLRLTLDGGQAKLTIAPGTLDPAARRRLRQTTLQQDLSPGIAYIAYRLSHRGHTETLDLARRNPELLAAAADAGYLTYQTDSDGHPASIELAPDVAYSLGLTTRPPVPSTAEHPLM
jgi:hypothetical protein